MSFLHRATFFTTAATPANLSFGSVAEVAFVGRSNSGKSSAINTLANQKRLAFTSKTPGRTQQINFFCLESEKFLVDLPGYGYAKVQKSEQRRWQAFLAHYLQTREPLAGLVLIMDIRHPFTELDRQMLDWFAPRERPVHVLLTKADKLGRQQQSLALTATQAELGHYGPNYGASVFSSLKKTGIETVEAVIARWLGIAVLPKPAMKGSGI